MNPERNGPRDLGRATGRSYTLPGPRLKPAVVAAFLEAAGQKAAKLVCADWALIAVRFPAADQDIVFRQCGPRRRALPAGFVDAVCEAFPPGRHIVGPPEEIDLVRAPWPAGLRTVAGIGFVVGPGNGVIVVGRARNVPLTRRETVLLEGIGPAEWGWARMADAILAAEQRRVACQLHDGFGQILTALHFAANELRPSASAGRVQDLALTAVQQLRQVLELATNGFESSGSDLDIGGVTRLVDALVESGVLVNLQCDVELTQLAREVSECLHRVAREALINVQRHAAATMVDIGVRWIGNGVELTVTDDGVGMQPHDKRTAHSMRFGLPLVRQAVEELGGTLHLEAIPRRGTSLTAWLPSCPHAGIEIRRHRAL